MVKIDNKKIKDEIEKLEKHIEDYEEIYLNLFNTINSMEDLWHDENAVSFFKIMEKEKEETQKITKFIKSQKNIYKYIYNNYKEIGDNVKCNLDSKEILIEKLNNCIDKTSEINKIFTQINFNKNYEEKEKIEKIKTRMIKVENSYKEVKDKVKNLFSKLEETEQEVNRRLDNLDIIKISDYSL